MPAGDPDDVVDMLRADHEDLRLKLQRLASATGESRRLMLDVERELRTHILAEEDVVRPAYHDCVQRPTDEAMESLHDRGTMERLLGRLRQERPGSEGFLLAVRDLRGALERHAAQQERHVLPMLEGCEAERRQDLALRVAQHKQDLQMH